MTDFSTAVDVALLIARVALGLTIFAHGYAKFFKGGKIEGTAGWFSSIGMKPGKMHAYFAALGEMGSGLFLAFGFFTSLAALGIVGLMAVAGWVVHRHNGFFIISEGWEYTFVIALFAVIIAMIGPGDISIDYATGLDENLDGWTGLIVAGGGGISAAALLLSIFYHPAKPEAEQPEAAMEDSQQN